MTLKTFMRMHGAPEPDFECEICDVHPVEVVHEQRDGETGFYCRRCAVVEALGLLRDVAELRVGKRRANKAFRATLDKAML